MLLPKHIDLHMHSTCSDGTDEPLELLEKVRETGLNMFSLTDHDATSGCETILKKLADSPAAGGDAGFYFLAGAEFSCQDFGGKYHILGYGYDPDADSIRRLVKAGHELRMKKLDGRIKFLKEKFGFVFSKEDIEKVKSLSNPGKPHLAQLMIRYGYVKTKKEAFHEYLNKKRFRSSHIKPEDAIEGILGAGGIPVLAHPSYGDGDQIIVGKELRERIEYLMQMGIEGLEAYYSGFTPKLEDELLGYAAEYDLYVTAGSDYHGTNKLIPLGETNLEDIADAAPGLTRFMTKVIEEGKAIRG